VGWGRDPRWVNPRVDPGWVCEATRGSTRRKGTTRGSGEKQKAPSTARKIELYPLGSRVEGWKEMIGNVRHEFVPIAGRENDRRLLYNDLSYRL
jgi:hypothetical protein